MPSEPLTQWCAYFWLVNWHTVTKLLSIPESAVKSIHYLMFFNFNINLSHICAQYVGFSCYQLHFPVAAQTYYMDRLDFLPHHPKLGHGCETSPDTLHRWCEKPFTQKAHGIASEMFLRMHPRQVLGQWSQYFYYNLNAGWVPCGVFSNSYQRCQPSSMSLIHWETAYK